MGYKPSVIQKAKFEYSPLVMSLSKAIKSSNDAKRPVKNNISLRYGSYSFVEFKHDAEKVLKVSSIDSKNEKINRFLQCLISSKSLLQGSLKIKRKKNLLKKRIINLPWRHDVYYDVHKNHYNKE